MDGRDAAQGPVRLWLSCWQDRQCAPHWLLLPVPGLPAGPHELGLGQLMGFGAESVTGKRESKALG